MTRDEAIKVVHATSGRFACSDEMADCLVNTWTALGMLKLDEEPKGPNERAVTAMFARGLNGMITPRHALQAIHEAGLKITER